MTIIEPSTITTPAGERLAVIPLAEYGRLVAAAEDLADIAAYDEVTRRLASGEEEFVPADSVARIVAGENPIRVFRELRGLSPSELAQRAGVSLAALTQLEAGTQTTTAVLQRVADALGLKAEIWADVEGWTPSLSPSARFVGYRHIRR